MAISLGILTQHFQLPTQNENKCAWISSTILWKHPGDQPMLVAKLLKMFSHDRSRNGSRTTVLNIAMSPQKPEPECEHKTMHIPNQRNIT